MLSSQRSSIESRISNLESIIGSFKLSQNIALSDKTRDIESRLKNIENFYDSSNLKLLHQEIKRNKQLEESVLPGTPLLTHQNYASNDKKLSRAPLVYRRQEVLSSKQFLQSEQDKLGYIQDLLLSSNRINSGGDDDDNAPQLHKSPIIESDNYLYASSPENKAQLEDVVNRVLNLSGRVNQMVDRLDNLTNEYNNIMVYATEKMITYHEKLSSKSE